MRVRPIRRLPLLIVVLGGCFEPDEEVLMGTESLTNAGTSTTSSGTETSISAGGSTASTLTSTSTSTTQASDSDTSSEGSSSGESEESSTGTTEAGHEASTDGTRWTCSNEGELDPACPDEASYCDAEGSCVSCTALQDGCAGLDPARPVCDASSGRCVECSTEDAQACTATQSACIDGTCSACTDHTQCSTGVCFIDEGRCLLEEVSIAGRITRADTLVPTPARGATVGISNVTGGPSTDGPTGDDGQFAFEGLAPGTLADLEIDLPQTSPVFVPATMSTRTAVMIPNTPEVSLEIPVVPYVWLAQVAHECGIFATVDEAIGGGVVNPYFIVRSTIVGRLVDEDGEGVPLVSRGALQATLGEWANFHENLLDTDTQPTHVCFLQADAAQGRFVGTRSETSDSSGRFVMFRVRNEDENGRGSLTVKSPGFDDAVVSLNSTGNIAWVDLVRNDQPITRDFAADVYPIFRSHRCEVCHVEGGSAENAVRDGYPAYFNSDLPPWDVWQNLVGPGLLCNDLDAPVRICVDDPERSLVVGFPLRDDDIDDVHPVDIFTSIDDPSLQVIVDWIEQGALPPSDLQFVTDVYPLFAKHGCTGCHGNGGPAEATLDGVPADWSVDPYTVWSNLVEPGTTCNGAESARRVCVDDPTASRLVQYPLAGGSEEAEVHPNKTFGALTDPDMQRILQWIAQGAEFEATCSHDECEIGDALTPGCSPCVTAVCTDDPFCCSYGWDVACRNRTAQYDVCGGSCEPTP